MISFFVYSECIGLDEFTAGDAYETNLTALRNSILSQPLLAHTGYSSGTQDNDQDKIYGFARYDSA